MKTKMESIKTKKLQLIVLIFISLLVTTLIAYNSNAIVSADTPESAIKITKATFLFNGSDITDSTDTIGPYQNGDTVAFTYEFEIPDATTVNDTNNTLTLNLPEVFKATEIQGDLLDDENQNYGTYEVKNNQLIFTITEKERVNEQSGIIGGARFDMTFDFKTSRVDEPYTLVLPFTETTNKTYHLIIKPSASLPAVKKSGIQDDTEKNRISWTVDVNADLDDKETLELTDRLDSRLSFDADSLKIYPLQILNDGSIVQGTDPIAADQYSVSTTLSSDDTPHQLSISIPVSDPKPVIPKAYRIIYDTTVDPDKIDTSKTEFDYENTANFNNSSSSAQVKITGGSIITKTQDGNLNFNTKEITWKIAVNTAGYPLKNVVISDVLPEGLTLDPNKIVVKDQDDAVRNLDSDTKKYDSSNRTMTVTLGDINTAYTIVVTAAIDPDYFKTLPVNGDTPYYSIPFPNTATLTQTQNAATVTTPAVSNSTDVKIGKLIYKTGQPSIGYNDAKYIDWQFYVNLAHIDTGTKKVTDTLGPGMSFPDIEAIKVYEVTLDANGTPSLAGEITTFTKSIDDQKLTVTFNDNIAQPYAIVYRALITNTDQTSFKNTGTIGIGAGITYEKTIGQVIANTYAKANTGFDYQTKTFNWRISVNPIKAGLDDLSITDTFSEGLMMTDDQFNTIVVKKGDNSLTGGEEADYTIEKTIVNGKIKGFVIKFNAQVNEALYTVDYQTAIDPDILSNNGNLDYANKAVFDTDKTEPIEKTTVPTIGPLKEFNGNKSGHIDPKSKTLTWEIDLNYLSKNIDNLEVSDDIEIDENGSGMKLKPESIKVYTDTVDSSGGLKSTATSTLLTDDELASKNIVITPHPETNSFSVKFNGTIQKPYRIVYEVDMVGISSTNYKNTAQTNVNEDYTATVPYKDGLTFVDKSGARVGDHVNWTVTINQGKSTINNFILTDKLSEGLDLVADSFKLYDENNQLLPFEDYFNLVMKDRSLSSDPQAFELQAKDVITDTYRITYQTAINYDNIISNQFTNKADVSGQYIVTGTTSKEVSIAHNILDSSGWIIGQYGKLTLTKENEDHLSLEGVKFDFYKGETKLGTLATDQNGEINVEKLKFGTYTLREVEALDGYQLTDEAAVFTITKDNYTTQQEKTITNYKYRTLEIIKTEKGKPSVFLSGAVFEIRNSAGEFIQTLTTDSNGKATVNLPYDTYTVTEKIPPLGYDNNDQTYTITLNQDKMTYSIGVENIKIISPIPDVKTNVSLMKTDAATGLGLPGAEITVYDKNGKTVATVTTGNDGSAITDKLAAGSYTFKETKAPAGYLISNQSFSFIINVDGTISGDTSFSNEQTKVILSKIDATTKIPLADAEITIFDNSGNIVSTTITGADGKTSIAGLPVGSYTFKETKAPEGYLISDETFSFIINSDGSVSGDDTISDFKLINEPDFGSIELMKIDDNFNPLAGAEFGLYNPVGTLIKTAVSNDEGLVRFIEVPFGSYTVRETAAPEGYALSDTESTVAVSADKPAAKASPYMVVNYDDKNPLQHGIIQIIKIDAQTKVQLPGAVFTLYNESGQAVQTVTTNRNGFATFSTVSPGIYSIRETTAPSGYQLSDEVINLSTVKNKTYEYTYANKSIDVVPGENNNHYSPNDKGSDTNQTKKLQETTLPQTGGFWDATTLGLAGAILVGLGIILKYQNRRKQNHEKNRKKV